MTAPSQVDYDDIQRVWREADTLPLIEHAWLFDHLMPIFGDPNGPAYEGWTLLSALAAQTQRMRVGLLVTSNRFRPPAMLAKIAATVDVVSGGRLDFGIGAGSRPSHPIARREYDAHGLPFHDAAPRRGKSRRSVHRHPAVVDRDRALRLPRRLRRSHRSILRSQTDPAPASTDPHRGRSAAVLRLVAEHADLWNIPGGDIDAGFGHLVLSAPYPAEVAQWVIDELIAPSVSP